MVSEFSSIYYTVVEYRLGLPVELTDCFLCIPCQLVLIAGPRTIVV